MKLWTHTPEIYDEEERREKERLDAILRARGYEGPSRLSDAARAALLVRTNERIDRAASGRALSLSWAVRVAVPGVVAIVAFFIGLHYYGTPVPREPSALLPILSALPAPALDSLMDAHAVVDSDAFNDQAGMFEIRGDAATEYLLHTYRVDLVAETLNDQQVEEILTRLTASTTAF